MVGNFHSKKQMRDMFFSSLTVLDFCFANNACGKHGCCVNTQSGFNCSCSFLYDGLRCEKSKINEIYIQHQEFF
jgi:hypothetical protein